MLNDVNININQIRQILKNNQMIPQLRNKKVTASFFFVAYFTLVSQPTIEWTIARSSCWSSQGSEDGWGKSPQVPKRMGRTDLKETRYLKKTFRLFSEGFNELSNCCGNDGVLAPAMKSKYFLLPIWVFEFLCGILLWLLSTLKPWMMCPWMKSHCCISCNSGEASQTNNHDKTVVLTWWWLVQNMVCFRVWIGYPPGNDHISHPSRHFWVDDVPFPVVGYVIVSWRVGPCTLCFFWGGGKSVA